MSVSHRRDWTGGVLLALAWVIAFSLSPVPDGPLSGVATMATVSILFCAGAMVLARLMPGIRSWADLGLLRANPEAWWVSGLLIAATSLGYVAVEWISSAVGNGVTWASSSTTGSIPHSRPRSQLRIFKGPPHRRGWRPVKLGCILLDPGVFEEGVDGDVGVPGDQTGPDST